MALLTTEGLTKRFGGLTAVDAVTFAVEAGDLVGIIGPNGAGKTTLFSLLSGFLRPDLGAVVFKDRRISGRPPHRIVDQGLARTFQVVRPFTNMTVLDNVATACVSPRARRMAGGRDVWLHAMEIIAAVELEKKAAQPVETLPFGDLRRLEIARALATHPELLLLDEPFSGLSILEAAPLVTLIGTLARRGTTILIVEHKLRELMQLVTRVIVMQFGQIIAEGPPAVVAQSPRVVEAYLGGTMSVPLR
ncbi:MAG TPA: ABC transporter ATP-binding protein [bacterium]|nr:ABC transporter ATP-binding protein [bacterium]